MNTPYQFQLHGDEIVCWNGKDGWSIIAKVVNLRQVKHLLRYAWLTEDVKTLMDVFIYDTHEMEKATRSELKSGEECS